MKYQMENDGFTVSEYEYFDPQATFDCGQCFRFSRDDDGAWSGVVRGAFVRVGIDAAGKMRIECEDEHVLRQTVLPFLSLDTDYGAIRAQLCAQAPDDTILRSAMEYGKGIRILRQEPWETLCSFILSQNNNIPRIKKIIETMCVRCGKPIADGRYAFPDPCAVAAAGERVLRECGAGFRAPYLCDAAERVCTGATDLAAIAAMPLCEAEQELRRIKGVGPKVAACVLLFGLGHADAFPVDVWVNRMIDTWYHGTLDPRSLGAYAGIAQQYLFYYARAVL